MMLLMLSVAIPSLVAFLFFLASKSEKWDSLLSNSFECGFSSYFFSHYSFSMHFYVIALIFLFLDLELCFLMPFFNMSVPDVKSVVILITFLLVLILGVLAEWGTKKLEWIFWA